MVTKELSSAGLVAAVGDATNAVVGAGSVKAGAVDEVAAGFTLIAAGAISTAVGATVVAGAASVPDIGALGSVTATRALAADEEDAALEDSFVDDAFALEVEPGAVEDGVEAGEDTPLPSAAKADGDNNAKSMAATATLTSSPPDVS